MRTRVALILFTFAFAILALEVGLRLYLSEYGDERQKILYLYTRQEINDAKSLFRGLTFLNYGLSPIREDVNSLGYRGPETVIPKPAGVYRIVALGGSTTFGTYLDTWEKAFPHQLQVALRTTYGHSAVELINAGVPGYTSWESAVNLLLRISDLEPDMIIVYHGVNDLNPRLSDPDYYAGLNIGKGIWIEHDDRLPASVLYRFALNKLGHDIRVTYTLGESFRQPADYRSCGLDANALVPYCRHLDMTVEDVLKENPPIYYERNLRNMVVLARNMGSRALLVTWSYSPYEYNIPGGDFMAEEFRQVAIAEHNEIVRDVADDLDTLFYDLADTMPVDPKYWIDGLHMSEVGTSEMARQLSQYLATAEVLPG